MELLNRKNVKGTTALLNSLSLCNQLNAWNLIPGSNEVGIQRNKSSTVVFNRKSISEIRGRSMCYWMTYFTTSKLSTTFNFYANVYASCLCRCEYAVLPRNRVDVGELTSFPLVEIGSAFSFSLNYRVCFIFLSFSRIVLALLFPAIRSRWLMYQILD